MIISRGLRCDIFSFSFFNLQITKKRITIEALYGHFKSLALFQFAPTFQNNP